MANNALVKQDHKTEVTTPERTRSTTLFTPRVDILETRDELVVYADLPGVKPSDVDVRYELGELIIEGRCEPRQEGVSPLFSEYGVGDYYRAFAVGENLDAERISADLKNGVLTVRLPKAEKVKPKRITVKGA